jgi:ATP-binding cassette subfamily B protein
MAADEQVLAWLEIDLDASLRFAAGLILVSNARLLAMSSGDESVRSWPYQPGLSLSRSDHAGVGTLELCATEARLAHWHYTLAADVAAGRLIDHFTRQLHFHVSGSLPAATTQRLCPSCETPLLAGQEQCPVCSKEIHQAPSTWTLLRLGRFARPYRGQLLAGFLLSLLGTAATLVPPYLTMPLMDKVLIPYQNGQMIDPALVALYLSGLLGAALVAWTLGWARTYILALVSERIGADLRTATYEHLLTLSQEYFGGKRTGDLMARIGSETDRINVFLSLHLLDFATDVLMIVMTTIILMSIDIKLALVTLLPLPIIAWLIHIVRERLRTGFERVDRVWAEVTNVLADTIPGIRVVKAFAQEARETSRFRTANAHNLEVNDRVNKVWSLFSPTVTLLTEIGLLIVWAFGIWQIAKDHISVGVLTAFLAYISRFYLRLDSMSRIVSVTQKAAAGAKRIFDILDHVSSVPEPATPVHLPKVTGRIELRGVGFRYGTRSVTRDISIAIAPGEMVGLVGHSGSGKSTLVNLICRFYDVSEGAILIDGVDIRSLAGGRVPQTYRPGAAGTLPLLRHHCREHRLRKTRGDACRGRRCCPRRARARVHPAPGARLRLAGRRTRPGTLGRRATAHLDRPGAAHRPTDPDPRRSHVVGRHEHRKRDSESPRQPGSRPHDDCHRAPPVHPARCRSPGRSRPRQCRRSRQPRAADGLRGSLLPPLPGAGTQRRR